MPNPARRAFRHVSRFTPPLHGVPSPTIRSFQIVSRFGSPLHGVPDPTMRSFRVISCFMGCQIPELRLCQQQVHRLSRYGCVLLCVSRQCAEPHALRTPQKNSLVDRPIYHFHFNIHFLKAPLALHWSQAPRHSVASYALACAPHAIVYFRCLLESLLDFRFGACRSCATEAATGAFPLFACLPCPRGCVTFFLYTFLCLVAMTTLALLSELLLSELDSDDVEDVPPLLELVVDELSVSDLFDSLDVRHSGRQSSSASLAGRCVPYLSPPSSPVVVACPVPSSASLST